MPGSDSLQPPLSPAERAIVKSYGGWTEFMNVYGLKVHDEGHCQEAKSIVQSLAQNDAADAKGSASK